MQEWMLSGPFYCTKPNPIFAERAVLFYPSIKWPPEMAVADRLNVEGFHIQIPACNEKAIGFVQQRKD